MARRQRGPQGVGANAHVDNFRPVVHLGSQQGLERAGVLEAPVGGGGLLCCQLLVGERFATEPMAGVILQRLT